MPVVNLNPWSYEYIRQLAQEATEIAKRDNLRPALASEVVKTFRNNRRFNIPFLGDYVPQGWERIDHVIEPVFVDTTGAAQPGESTAGARPRGFDRRKAPCYRASFVGRRRTGTSCSPPTYTGDACSSRTTGHSAAGTIPASLLHPCSRVSCTDQGSSAYPKTSSEGVSCDPLLFAVDSVTESCSTPRSSGTLQPSRALEARRVITVVPGVAVEPRERNGPGP